MNIPPEDQKDQYSYDEVQHLVARETMKNRMHDFERGLTKLGEQVKESNTELKIALKAIEKGMERAYEHTTECRNDLRTEIERDFVTKVEFVKEMGKLERQWIKATTATSTVLVVIGAIGKLSGWL